MCSYTEVEGVMCPECETLKETAEELFDEMDGFVATDDIFENTSFIDKDSLMGNFVQEKIHKCKECAHLFPKEHSDHECILFKCTTCNKLYEEEDEADECCSKGDMNG